MALAAARARFTSAVAGGTFGHPRATPAKKAAHAAESASAAGPGPRRESGTAAHAPRSRKPPARPGPPAEKRQGPPPPEEQKASRRQNDRQQAVVANPLSGDRQQGDGGR